MVHPDPDIRALEELDRRLKQVGEPFPFDQRERLEAAFTIGSLYPRLFRTKSTKLQPVELLLLLACEFTDYLSQRQIAGMLDIDEGAVSRGFTYLREKQYVTDEPDPEINPETGRERKRDGRIQQHRLLKKGHEELQALADRIYAAHEDYMPYTMPDKPYYED